MKCVRSLVGMSQMDRVRNEEVRRIAGIERRICEYSGSESILRWFGHVERIDGQKGVDGGSKWRAGTRETEVGLEGWCKGGNGQQRNGGRGCESMRERSESGEPWYICN